MTRRHILSLFLLFLCPAMMLAQKDGFMLIITSFQIELNNYQTNVSELYTEINREHPHMQYIVENMNCRSLSEINEWRGRMKGFTEKYSANKPCCVVLLGNEAWASYMAVNNEFTRTVPCFAMLVNDRLVQIPDTAVDVQTWEPQMSNYSTDMTAYCLKGAIAYHYDVEANVRMALDLFPKTRRITFFTDNTFGGLNQRGLINEFINSGNGTTASHLVMRMIDGRTYTFESAGREYSKLKSEWDVAMFSTWRIDSTGNYLVKSVTGQLLQYSDSIPGVSVTSMGLGSVSVGGIMPRYGCQGQRMGQMINRWLSTGLTQHVVTVENVPRFDYSQLNKWGISSDRLPDDAVVDGRPLPFYDEHPQLSVVFAAVVVILIICVVFIVVYMSQSRRNFRRQQDIMTQLAAAKEKAEEANRLKSNFLANMSHEVRTPLNAIVGFADLIVAQHKELSEAEFAEISGLISENTEQLVKLINDVLDLSAIESHSTQMTPEEIDLAALGRSLMTVERFSNAKKNIKLLFECPDGELSCVTDKRYLQQVIINLLNNAIKFTDKGTVTLRIERDGDEIRFTVTDTGVGIPRDKQKAVFERFEKLDRFSQGTGLGLSICRTIVDELGGRIWIDAEYMHGARFIFTLPQ